MTDYGIEELDMRIMICNSVLKWLRSDDPMLSDPQYAHLVPEAIKTYTGQYDSLVDARRRKMAASPVKVGLGTAKIKPIVKGV